MVEGTFHSSRACNTASISRPAFLRRFTSRAFIRRHSTSAAGSRSTSTSWERSRLTNTQILLEELHGPRPRIFRRREICRLLDRVTRRLRVVLRAHEPVHGSLVVRAHV